MEGSTKFVIDLKKKTLPINTVKWFHLLSFHGKECWLSAAREKLL